MLFGGSFNVTAGCGNASGHVHAGEVTQHSFAACVWACRQTGTRTRPWLASSRECREIGHRVGVSDG